MTLFTLSNLYAEDLSLPDIAVKPPLRIRCERNDESLLSGGSQFLKTKEEENWGGNPNFHLQAGWEPTTLDTMNRVPYSQRFHLRHPYYYNLSICDFFNFYLWPNYIHFLKCWSDIDRYTVRSNTYFEISNRI